METALVQKQQNGQIIDQIIADINAVPELASLPDKAKRLVAKSVIFDRYKDELRGKADIARIDYEKEKQIFLKACKSKATRTAYAASLIRLEAWCGKNDIHVLEMTPKEADDYIYSISAEGRGSASTILDVAGASSFLTWLSRRHPKTVTNPFRGTRARPKKIAKKELLIPDEAEVEIIIDHFKGSTKAAVIVMARAGLRVGALPSLTIRDGKFTCQTKGKQQRGTLTPEVLKALKPFGAKPFAERTAAGIRESVVFGMETMLEAKKIRARYSCHDLRHAYAVSEYRKDKDIYRVSQLLGHHNVSITQTYLKGLGYGD